MSSKFSETIDRIITISNVVIDSLENLLAINEIDMPSIVAGVALSMCRIARVAGIADKDVRIIVELALKDAAENIDPSAGAPN